MNTIKRISFIILLQFIYQIALGQCDVAKIVSVNRTIIGSPYQYDGFLIHEMPFVENSKGPKEIHSEFIAFKKQVYKVVFCASGFDEDVIISIYNKKKPTVKIAEQTVNTKLTRWVFEPLNPGVYDIVYKPATSTINIEHKGCIVMLIGFKK
jgi:hypothetical protein